MTCARCPNPTPITVLQAGEELCRGCADLPREDREAKPENAPPPRAARRK
jgi:hypothetical protein